MTCLNDGDCLNDKIELVDKNKVVRIRFGVDEGNNVYFSLNDKEGRERLIFSVDAEGNGGLGFRTAQGQPTVTLCESTTLGSRMMMLDVPNEICLTLGIANGSGEIRLDTKEGAYSWPTPDAKP
jgi:hypothetical protein